MVYVTYLIYSSSGPTFTSMMSECVLTILPGRILADNGPVQDLFICVFKLAIKGNAGNHGRNGYFFGESGEYTM